MPSKKNRMRLGRVACRAGTLAALVVAARASALPGDIPTRFEIDDANPMSNVPTLKERNEDPMEFAHYLQNLIARGEGAVNKKDWENAVKYYEVLATVVPDRAVSFSRLCIAYSELGKLDRAIDRCGRTLELGGARVFDHFRFIDVMLRKPELTPSDVAQMDASIAHLRAHAQAQAASTASASASVAPSAAPSAAASAGKKKTREELIENFKRKRDARILAQLSAPEDKKPDVTMNLPLEIEVSTCRIGVRSRDPARLKPCIAALRGLKAPEKLVLPFEWAEALTRRDGARAAAILTAAREAGFPEAALKAMVAEQEKTLSEESGIALLKRWGPFGAIVFAIMTLIAIVLSKRARAGSGVRGSNLASEGAATASQVTIP
jgi:hypothetical protein